MNRQQGGMLAVLAGVVLVAGLVQPAGAVQEYWFVDLGAGPAGFDRGFAYAGSDGQQFGMGGGPAAGGAGDRHALMWSGTSDSAVDLNPTGFRYSSISAAADGQQVGYGWGPATGPFNSGYPIHALVWSGTAESAIDLNPAGFDQTVANGVDNGRQVGYGLGTITSGAGHALLWTGAATGSVDLHPAGYDESGAHAIYGEDIVGAGNRETARALLWRGATHTVVDLHPAWATWSTAEGTFADEQVGQAWTATYARHAVLWRGSAESAVDLHPEEFLESAAYALFGGMQTGYGRYADGTSRALLWSGTADSVFDLHQFVPSGYDSSRAYGMDEQGNIFGFAYNASDYMGHAGMWVPVPEPATLSLLALGGLLIARRRRA